MKPISRRLKNGLQAIVDPQKGATSMTLMVLVKVGSRYETKSINGASHFIEHLMFKGTKKRPTALLISKELDRYGAEYNAFTSKDLTAYYVKMDAAKTELAIDMLHDMIFNSRYDKKDIDRERGVIIEEINMYEDNPRMHIEDLLEETLFPNSTLGWNIAGPRQVIRDISRQDLVDYRDRYYIPSRITLVISGKIIPNIWTLLEKTFGKIKQPKMSQDSAFKKFNLPAKLAKPISVQSKKTEQVQLGIAFHGFSWHDKRLAATSLLSTILGGTMSSRLFTQVRERRGLCYSISASHQPLEDVGIFTVMSGLEKKRVDEAVKVIWGELKKMTKTLVNTEELQGAKDHIRGKLLLAFEDSSTHADWYGKQWVFQGKLVTLEERLREINRVTATDIRNAAKALFRTPSMAAAVIGPFEHPSTVERMFQLT